MFSLGEQYTTAMCLYVDVAAHYIFSRVESFEAKRWKLSHVVVQQIQYVVMR